MLESWFPRNYEIMQGVGLTRILFAGTGWQIFEDQQKQSVLIVEGDLVSYWINKGYLEEAVFSRFLFGKNEFYFLISAVGTLLTPVSATQDFVTYEDGLSFAIALQASRKVDAGCSFSNGIFVERYSRILPGAHPVEQNDDSIVLGRWLSRGIEINATSIRRMLQLLPTVTKAGLLDILNAAHIQLVANEIQEKRDCLPPQKESFSLPGRHELETFFMDHVIDIIENPSNYKQMGIDFPSAFILQGPPGCGKTYAVDKLVEYLDWPCFAIDSSAIGSPFIHETSKKISDLFQKAIDNAPSVLVIDEMESFLSSRASAGTGSSYHVEEVAEFLRKIPEATQKHVLVIAMTNMIDSIDPAICRKGRFDHILEVNMPNSEEIEQVLLSLLRKTPYDQDIDIKKIVASLSGHPMSDVAFTVKEAARLTAKEHKSAISNQVFDTILLQIDHLVDKMHRPIGFGTGKR